MTCHKCHGTKFKTSHVRNAQEVVVLTIRICQTCKAVVKSNYTGVASKAAKVDKSKIKKQPK